MVVHHGRRDGLRRETDPRRSRESSSDGYKTKETAIPDSLFFITHLIFIIQLFFDREELERQVDQIAEVLTLVEHVLIVLLVIPMNFNIGSRIEKSV